MMLLKEGSVFLPASQRNSSNTHFTQNHHVFPQNISAPALQSEKNPSQTQYCTHLHDQAHHRPKIIWIFGNNLIKCHSSLKNRKHKFHHPWNRFIAQISWWAAGMGGDLHMAGFSLLLIPSQHTSLRKPEGGNVSRDSVEVWQEQQQALTAHRAASSTWKWEPQEEADLLFGNEGISPGMQDTANPGILSLHTHKFGVTSTCRAGGAKIEQRTWLNQSRAKEFMIFPNGYSHISLTVPVRNKGQDFYP